MTGYKRPTQINIPKWPNYNQLKQWVSKIGRNRWSVSQYTDQREVAWVAEVWERSYDELGDPGESRFALMDNLIVIGLETMLPKTSEVKYHDKLNGACKLKKAVLGRRLSSCAFSIFGPTLT